MDWLLTHGVRGGDRCVRSRQGGWPSDFWGMALRLLLVRRCPLVHHPAWRARLRAGTAGLLARGPHLFSLRLPPLGKKGAVALAQDTAVRGKGKAAPAWPRLARAVPSSQAKEGLAPGCLIADPSQSASSSLRASRQRRDNTSLPGRQLLLSATWLSPSCRLHYLQNRIVSGNLRTSLGSVFRSQQKP